jgi:L-cysteine S-thiosulfotransferase
MKRTLDMKAILSLALVVSCVLLATGHGLAQSTATKAAVPAATVDAAIAAAFAKAPAEWQPRLSGDATMQGCSAAGNLPASAEANAITAREKATIQYPADGSVIGDWARGEKIAQSGYGLRFTDYPATQPNGGNCYACHQMTKAEVSYGTIGPSLLEYGKIRKFTPEDSKAAYEKIYNSHAALPCSLMPRFGTNKILTVEQIKDVTALLMSPDSPVNK